MQIESTRCQPLHDPIRMPIIRQTLTNIGEEVKNTEASYTAAKNVKWFSPSVRQFDNSSKSSNHYVTQPLYS